MHGATSNFRRLDAEAIRGQKVELLRALHCPDPLNDGFDCVRARYGAGQVRGHSGGGDKHSASALIGVHDIATGRVGGSVGGGNVYFAGQLQLREYIHASLHGGQIRVRPHEDGDERGGDAHYCYYRRDTGRDCK